MTESTDRVTIGLISDTHGMLRASVHKALDGVDLILHAGDVGGSDILDELRLIAPVQAVHGNTDPFDDPSLPPTIVVTQAGVNIRVTHGHELGSPTPARLAAAYAEPVIVYGHTHRQLITRAKQRLIINPGAAGARRFNLEPSVARLTIHDGTMEVELVPLD
jgi:putative phosphoesterase